MHKFVTIWLVLATCLANVAAGADRPASRVPIGRQTTFFDGPLDETGEIDYETALNQRLRGNITAERNAQVLLIQALGPAPEGGDGLPAKYFQALGIPQLPLEGDYFSRLGRLKPQQKPVAVDGDKWIEDQEQAAKAPWKPADFPEIADWLKVNEPQLKLVLEATRRDQMFNPLATRDVQNRGVVSALLPHVQMNRELGRALLARAMLRLGEGLPDEAWEDLLAVHRLARLVSQGTCIIEFHVGYAIENMAADTDVAYLKHCRLSSRQLRRRIQDLQNLPPFGTAADKIDLSERILCLDTLRLVRQERFAHLPLEFTDQFRVLTAEQKRKLAAFDWVVIQKTTNLWHDRFAAAVRQPTRTLRRQMIAQLTQELTLLAGPPVSLKSLTKLLFDEAPGRTLSQAFAARATFLMLSYLNGKALNLHDRCQQLAVNLQVAYALTVYHRDHKRYPERLSELSPEYLAKMPQDLFSDKRLLYKTMSDGFVLYSVGVNGKDDGGRGLGEGPGTDDLAIRLGKSVN